MLHWLGSNRMLLRKPNKPSGFEQLMDERDFALSTTFLVMDMSAFDGSDGFNTAQGRLSRTQ